MAVAMVLIETVDAAARETVDYARDIDVYGERERWGLPVDTDGDGRLEDDCDGAAVWAWHQLRDLGVAKTDLAIATCHTKGRVGINHLVLLVAGDDGHWHTCADTADRGPTVYSRTGYRWDQWTSDGTWWQFEA